MDRFYFPRLIIANHSDTQFITGSLYRGARKKNLCGKRFATKLDHVPQDWTGIGLGCRSLQNGRIVLKIGIRAKLTAPDRLVASRVTFEHFFMAIRVFSKKNHDFRMDSENSEI